uniref:Uncharacterized protein n=1 Tax=Chromera velia CCMP2878 TaxID=1169474 RepID=A0A0G4F075_9ALVE|eukprot:Cvel_2598.t1-p1 / transcript=Cvel_2598.t1 / gene=Cvel_2598 / organism=Chromera_velia_CCMP2878 / gene_product=hypothetical protein / transcript_product=hypothetical protein / location=Cvel_scaffold102:130513-134349(+) / protein_length=472 / sequence_SO=supercontig / SO=protein_coding / is_pseudo=false
MVMYMDKNCCQASNERKELLRILNPEGVATKLDLLHFVRRMEPLFSHKVHPYIPWFMREPSNILTWWEPRQLQKLRDAVKANHASEVPGVDDTRADECIHNFYRPDKRLYVIKGIALWPEETAQRLGAHIELGMSHDAEYVGMRPLIATTQANLNAKEELIKHLRHGTRFRFRFYIKFGAPTGHAHHNDTPSTRPSESSSTVVLKPALPEVVPPGPSGTPQLFHGQTEGLPLTSRERPPTSTSSDAAAGTRDQKRRKGSLHQGRPVRLSLQRVTELRIMIDVTAVMAAIFPISRDPVTYPVVRTPQAPILDYPPFSTWATLDNPRQARNNEPVEVISEDAHESSAKRPLRTPQRYELQTTNPEQIRKRSRQGNGLVPYARRGMGIEHQSKYSLSIPEKDEDTLMRGARWGFLNDLNEVQKAKDTDFLKKEKKRKRSEEEEMNGRHLDLAEGAFLHVWRVGLRGIVFSATDRF